MNKYQESKNIKYSNNRKSLLFNLCKNKKLVKSWTLTPKKERRNYRGPVGDFINFIMVLEITGGILARNQILL